MQRILFFPDMEFEAQKFHTQLQKTPNSASIIKKQFGLP